MTNRKGQNSILFVATLGVYLGLVLVGAPHVLAQAATTRQFDVKDEIEKKDDLDKNPNGCDLARSDHEIKDLETEYLWFNDRSISEYQGLLEQVLEAFPQKVGEVDINWTSIGDRKASRRVTTAITLPIADPAAHGLDDDVIFVGNGLPGKTFSFSFFRNRLEDRFRFESRSVPYDSALVRSLYGSAFDHHRCFGSLELEQLLLKRTEVNVEGTNLVITTRLPRGSLDALLATNAK